MNTPSDFDRHASAWLADGPAELSDRVLDAALREVHQTRQRRRWSTPWRTPLMSLPLRAAAVIAIVAVAGVVTLNLIGSGGIGSSPTPTPVPQQTITPTALPTTNPLLDTTAWTSYTSSQYGFVVRHPSGWSVQPADHPWNIGQDAADPLSTATDSFSTPGTADGQGVRVSFWSVPFEYSSDTQPTEEVKAWFQDYCQRSGSTQCAELLPGAVPLCIEVRDCHPGILVAPPLEGDVQAFFSGGWYAGRMVVASLWRSDGDPSVAQYGGGRKLLEAFLSTMCVWPADSRPAPPDNCAQPETLTASPTPPATAGWTKYTSAQYGYQISYPPEWHVDSPATRNWVLATDRLTSPVNGMNGSADKFIGPYTGDEGGHSIAVTGFAADVPAGTSEQAWLDAYYAGGTFCPTNPAFVVITVDGHPGRLDPCYDAQAIVFIGKRVYVFAIQVTDSQPLFASFLSTVKFP